MNIDQVLEYVEEQDVKFISLSFCDVFGKQKNVFYLQSIREIRRSLLEM